MASDVPSRRIRVLVVDDHPVVRFGLVGLLRTQDDIDVVGDAASSQECLAKVIDLSPDVVILDLEMQDSHGTEALSVLRDQHPDVATVVYTAFDNDWRVAEAVKIGIQGYVKKETRAETLFEAVRIVGNGGTYLDPAVASKVMGQLGRKYERRRVTDRSLSERERTVLQLIAEGKRNREISETLRISERTVKFHITALFRKLGATNRTEAVKIAGESGLIKN